MNTWKYIAIIPLMLFFVSAHGQQWVDMMQDPEEKFENTVRAFEQWWGDREVTKGSGYKQFQRWKYYMESRVTEDGKQSGPQRTLEAFESYRNNYLLNNNFAGETAEWTEIGPADLPLNGTGQPNGVGRIAAIAFHPTDANVVFAGAPSGGFRKSTDYGLSWTNFSTGLVRLGISTIVVHPTNPDIIYIGTGDRDGGDAPGYGVWRTTDGGMNWFPWNTGMGNRVVYEILMDPNDSDIMIASTVNNIYRTTDGGANWGIVYNGGEDFKDIAFHPSNSDIVYASGNDFYRSIDNGVTWSQVTSGVPTGAQRIAIAVTSANPNYVYLIAGDGGGFDGLYRSTDSGATFTTRSSTPNILGYDVTGGSGSQAWYDLVALGDPADANHIIIGGINIWESFDGGTTWSIVSHWTGGGGNPAIHADQHVLEWNPHTGHLFAGHDGGIHYSTNAGVNFTEISSGLGISQIYKIGQSQTKEGLTIAGFQDNGTALINNGIWRTEIGGDGMECIVDYSDANVMYGALYYGDVRRSSNGGNSFSQIAKSGVNGITESGAWVTPYKLHPTNPDAMFIGYNNIWYSTNCKSAVTNAVTWTPISSLGTGSTIRDIGIAPSDPNTIYFSRSGSNNFYRSINALSGSPTWTDLDGFLPGTGYPKDIEIHPTDPQTLWIALGSNIFKSIDGGSSWSDISGTLPNISLNTIALVPNSTTEAMYVGMDVGVYYKDNTLADWVFYGDFLPNVEITELEIYFDADCIGQSKLKAATYGRGVWETPLYESSGLPPSVCFEASSMEACTYESITLVDYTAYSPTSWSWTISPPNYSFIAGTSASSQSPVVQFSDLGVYTITLTATNANGSDMEQKTDYIHVNTTALSLPVYENFETMSNCGTSSDCGSTVCPLSNGWINMTNDVDDNIDWRVDEGGTPSAGTGPGVDANPGTAVGNYIYTEASSCSNRTAVLVSPCISLIGASDPQLSFAYYMEGTNMGELHIDIKGEGGWAEDVTPALIGDQGAGWIYRNVSLFPYIGQVITIRFRGTTGDGFRSDIALDDIVVEDLGICMVNSLFDSGSGTIRSCIENASPGREIVFDASINNQEIILSSGPLIVSEDISITCSPANNIVLSAGVNDRALDIMAGHSVVVSGMDIRSGIHASGRGIRNAGNLTLIDVDLFDNSALAGTGSLLENTGQLNIEGNCNLSIEESVKK